MLIQFTAAFVLGLLLGSYLPYLPCTVAFILFCIAAGISFLEIRHALSCTRGVFLYAVVLIGLVYWTAAANRPFSATVYDPDKPQRIAGEIVEPVKFFPSHMVLTLETPGSRMRVTWRDPERAFLQGDRVEVFARVRPPMALRNPGGFDYATYLRHHSIQGIVSVTGSGKVRLVTPPPTGSWGALWHRVDSWRERVRQAALHDFGEPALGVFLGMVIGMPGYISPAVRDSFMATGAVHILSISGSHLGLIAFLCFFSVRHACSRLPAPWLLALSRRIVPARLAAVVTVIPVAFYTVLAGAEVATVRSFVMIVIFLLAVWLGRQQHLLTALAAAALAILIHDPDALFDISFQLSYLSVLAIALAIRGFDEGDADDARPQAMDWPARVRKWGRNYIVVTIGVTMVTIPLVAYHFNQIAWLGLVGNLIAVPLAGFVLVPLGLGSAVWMLMTGGPTLPLSSMIEPAFSLLVGALDLLAKIPGAAWHVASPTLASILGFYGLTWLVVRRDIRKMFRIAAAAGVLTLAGLWIWSPKQSGDGDSLRITFLDVGQGDATVIELPDGQTVLIDAGAAHDTFDLGRSVVGPFLWDRGVRRLDHVIATHPQLDHVGGLPWIMREFRVQHYWDSQIPRDEPLYRRLHDAVQGQGLAEARAVAGQVILSSGGCRLLVLNPPVDAWTLPVETVARNGRHLNNHSVVTQLDCGPQSFLFTADVEVEALDWMSRSGHAMPARVLKIPHHGSKGSIDRNWIRLVRPDVAVISVGQRNHYGHPAQDTIDAYASEGIRVFRTDRDGAVWFSGRLSSPALHVHSVRDSVPRVLRPDFTVFSGERRNLVLLAREWMGWNR